MPTALASALRHDVDVGKYESPSRGSCSTSAGRSVDASRQANSAAHTGTTRDNVVNQCIRPETARRLAAAGGLDCGDVNLFHLHHRVERALGGSGIAIR